VTEPATQKPWERTEHDYLRILSEDPNASFGEYDNVPVLFDMLKRGLITWRKDTQNVFTSMQTCLWPELTEAGRSALNAKGE